MWNSPQLSGKRRLDTWLLVMVALLLLCRTAVAVVTGDGIGWDFKDNFYRVGTELYQGHPQNLYNVDPYRGYAGAPITAYLFAPLGQWSPRIALAEFKLICALCFAVGFWMLYSLFAEAARPRLRQSLLLPAYLAAILLFEPFWFVFAVGGQSTAICFPLLVLFLRSYLSGRMGLASVALSVGILLKPFLAPVILILAFAGEWRLLILLVASGSVEAVLSLALLGLPIHLAWLTSLQQLTRQSVEAWWNNGSIWNVPDSIWVSVTFHKLIVASSTVTAWRTTIGWFRLALVPIFAFLAARTNRAGQDPIVRRRLVFDLAILFCMLQSLVVWPHYLAFLFPTLLLAAFRLAPHMPIASWLSWAALASTINTRAIPQAQELLEHLGAMPLVQGLAAGVYGSAPLLITLALFSVCCVNVVRAKQKVPGLTA